MDLKSGKNNKIKKRNNYKLLSLSPNIIRNDIRIKFKFKKSNEHNLRYKNNSFIIINNNSKYQSLSDNFASNRSVSAKNSRTHRKKLSNKIQISNSNSNFNIKLNNSRNKYKVIYSSLSNDLLFKNEIKKRSNSILMKVKTKFDEKNRISLKKRKFNLKNFLKNEDFYFSKMN